MLFHNEHYQVALRLVDDVIWTYLYTKFAAHFIKIKRTAIVSTPVKILLLYVCRIATERVLKSLFLLISMCNITDVKAMEKGDFYVSANYGIGITNKFNHNEPEDLPIGRPCKANVLSIAIGKAIADNIRTEISYSRFYKIQYRPNLPSDMANYDIEQKQRADVLFISAYFDINKFSKLNPYFGVGVGVSQNKSGNIDVVRKNPKALIERKQSDIKKQLAWHISTGFNYNVNNHVIFNLIGYRFNSLGNMETKNNNKNALNIHNIHTGVTIKF